MDEHKIENWIHQKDISVFHPSDELISRLRQIPSKNMQKEKIVPNWIVWFAAACFIGFTIINFSMLKNNQSEKNIMDSYFPTSSY